MDTTTISYANERDAFLRDLRHFHDIKGTSIRRIPELNGREVDLYLLYTLVTEQGGWLKVNSRNTWSELFEPLKLPENCVNASIALKQIYLRYLARWEKVHFLGDENDRASDDDDEARHKRGAVKTLHSVPSHYNYHQHNIAESAREYNNLSTALYKASDYDRLGLSLLSPLPNEQDFAINVCTLLSNDGKHTLKLEKHPRLLDFLLAHAGVFNHGSLRNVLSDCYANIRKQNINDFWRDTLDAEEFLDLTDENLFTRKAPPPQNRADNIDLVAFVDLSRRLAPNGILDESEPRTVPAHDDSDRRIVLGSDNSEEDNFPKAKGVKLKFQCDRADRELFNLGRNLGTRDYMGQRVLQVATILRNLSFFDENLPVLVRNRTFVRFTLLCACSKWNQLMNLGLEMLGNLAAEFQVKDAETDEITATLIKIVVRGLQTEDRNWCITALEVLNKLGQNEANEETLLRHLGASVYERVCSFLTIHDVMLLIYTLECLYSLSSLGERACNYIVNIYGAVDTLVSLVTVEGKSYGPKACIGMKLVETVTGGVSAPPPTTTNSTTAVSTTTTTSPTTTNVNIASPSAPAAVPVHNLNTTKTTTPSTPQRQVTIAPQRLLTASPAPSTPGSTALQSHAQQLQQKHAHQQTIQENEQFALSWLRATYELCASNRIEQQELYKQYINSCAKIGRRGVIAPTHFPRCVRSVFGGTVGPNPDKSTNANEPQYYDGIKVRAQPLVINVQSTTQVNPTTSTPVKGIVRRLLPSTNPHTAGDAIGDEQSNATPASPASPILKAQLSAPPKPREAATPVAACKADVAKSQALAHPHLSQALLGSGCANPTNNPTSITKEQGQSNTSLIKSLLATKVNECMTTVSMRTDCQSVVQVAARQQQQRLLAQQQAQQQTEKATNKIEAKCIRLNGARQLFLDNDVADPAVSSTTQSTNAKTRREPPQPPPPLAPLSKCTKAKSDNEDSDSAASTGGGNIGIGGVSSTEDGENSMNSFDGLLNGIPTNENPISVNEDSNSKDSINSNATSLKKPLMLADLLEKKVDKDPPMLNGILGKEIRIGDKGLELVDNHIDKVLSNDVKDDTENNDVDDMLMSEAVMDAKGDALVEQMDERIVTGLKRSASDDIADETEVKKPHLTNNVNGNVGDDSLVVTDSVTSTKEEQATASNAAAKLFADLAADILEDEEEEIDEEQQSSAESEPPTTPQTENQSTPASSTVQQTPVRQVYVDGNQQMIIGQPRQIIVSQPTSGPVVLPAGAQIKTQSGQTVIVQNSAQQRPPVVQSSVGPILLSQSIQGLQQLQGQMQLVPSGQPGQFVLQAAGTQGFVLSQQHNAQGQPQTVLLAQSPQQQSSTKTIIILQPNSSTATHHQKVVVTPQGQQMVVTQVQRPILPQSTIGSITPTTSVMKSVGTSSVVVTQNCSNGVSSPQSQLAVSQVKSEGDEAQNTISVSIANISTMTTTSLSSIKPKLKPTRDVNILYICEWGDCEIDTTFKSANQVFLHVCKEHIPDTNDELLCQWDRCDNMKRKRFSLMTHINDKHCNTEAMKVAQIKRKVIQQTGKVDPPPPPQTSQHPGYAPDAAFHAIKRHALEFVNPKELQRTPAKQGTPSVPVVMARTGASASDQDDNEGPVTKSIRLTASLILRNLVIYSNNCRRYLKPYEPHLANVALSNVESSRTIAQVLYDMNDGASSHR